MKLTLIRCVSVTIIVFGSMWSISLLTQFRLFTAFDLIYQAVSDLQLTDYAFSYLRPAPKTDQRIVIVNVGDLSRRDIAAQVNQISRCGPRVIGLDVFFTCEGGLRDSVNCPQMLDPIGNLLLGRAIKQAGNVVLVSKLMQTQQLAQEDIDEYDSLLLSDDMFQDHARHGFATIPTNARFQDDVKLCRTMWPNKQIKGRAENAFSVEVAAAYDSIKGRKFLERGRDEEIVNFRGNVEDIRTAEHTLKSEGRATTFFNNRYSVVDVDQLLSGAFASEMFRDKIVLIGYLGDSFGHKAWEDKFYTPLNKKLGGRANPDMYGVVVHANIISMILDEDYVNELPGWFRIMLAIVLCMATVRLFIWVDAYLPIWYDALSVAIQVFQLFVLMGIVVWTFAKFTFSLELELTFGATALVGPCYDIYKGFENQFRSGKKKHLTQQP